MEQRRAYLIPCERMKYNETLFLAQIHVSWQLSGEADLGRAMIRTDASTTGNAIPVGSLISAGPRGIALIAVKTRVKKCCDDKILTLEGYVIRDS